MLLVVGLARLSSNWLVARLATFYIEIIRNIPLLLQMLFWYFAVLQVLPQPRDSLTFLGGLFFLNNRGFYAPKPIFEAGLSAGFSGVHTGPGATQFTRMRRGRSSDASTEANDTTAALLAE